jgi:hypothetical protein
MSVSAGLRPEGECGNAMCMSFERSDILTCLINAPITVEDSGCQTCSEGELLPMEELFFEGPPSNSWREDVDDRQRGMITVTSEIGFRPCALLEFSITSRQDSLKRASTDPVKLSHTLQCRFFAVVARLAPY